MSAKRFKNSMISERAFEAVTSSAKFEPRVIRIERTIFAHARKVCLFYYYKYNFIIINIQLQVTATGNLVFKYNADVFQEERMHFFKLVILFCLLFCPLVDIFK